MSATEALDLSGEDFNEEALEAERARHARYGHRSTGKREQARAAHEHHEALGNAYDEGRRRSEGPRAPRSMSEEEAASYNEGAKEAHGEQAARLRKRNAQVARDAAGHLSRAGSAVASGAGSAASGRGLSAWGVLAAILGLIGLYLLLTRVNLANGVTAGAFKALQWFIAPDVLPI